MPKKGILHKKTHKTRKSRKKKQGLSTGVGLSLLFLLPFLLLIAFLLFGSHSKSNTDTSSDSAPTVNQTATKKRDKLSSDKCQESSYYKDEQDMIQDPARLQVGMETFYKTTGVQPFIYFTKTQDLDMETAERAYDSLFSDDGHFLLMIHSILDSTDTEKWTAFYYLGSEANGVIDEDLLDQFWDNYDTNYYDNDLSTEEMLSNTFYQTAAVFSTDSTLFRKASNGGGTSKVWFVLLVLVLIAMLIIVIWMIKTKKDEEKARAVSPAPGSPEKKRIARPDDENDEDIRTF